VKAEPARKVTIIRRLTTGCRAAAAKGGRRLALLATPSTRTRLSRTKRTMQRADAADRTQAVRMGGRNPATPISGRARSPPSEGPTMKPKL
jgi:hypothetical protein